MIAIYDTLGNVPANSAWPMISTPPGSAPQVPVIAGRTYYIRIGGVAGATGTGDLIMYFAPNCPADFNNDRFIDFFDYLDFVQAFSSGC